MTRLPRLLDLRIGDPLPEFPENIGSHLHFRSHIVVDVRPVREGIELQTTAGAFLFDSLEDRTRFPRRPGNATENWCLTARHPQLHEVAYGDILPPSSPRFLDPRSEPDWADWPEDEQKEELQNFWRDVESASAWQMVSHITDPRKFGLLFLHVIDFSDRLEKRYVFTQNDAVRFPWKTYERPAKKPRIPAEEYPRSGRYVWHPPFRKRNPREETVEQYEAAKRRYDEDQDSGRIVQFAINPGAGRYPKDIPEYMTPGAEFTKPPSRRKFKRSQQTSGQPYVDEWNMWRLIDGPRHPLDPRK